MCLIILTTTCENVFGDRAGNVFGVLQVPDRFLEVAQVTLREFFNAIVAGKDADPSWKKERMFGWGSWRHARSGMRNVLTIM